MNPIWSTSLALVVSILILWTATITMRQHRVVRPLVPFFGYGVLLVILAAFAYCEMTLTTWWYMLEIGFFLCFATFLAVLQHDL